MVKIPVFSSKAEYLGMVEVDPKTEVVQRKEDGALFLFRENYYRGQQPPFGARGIGWAFVQTLGYTVELKMMDDQPIG